MLYITDPLYHLFEQTPNMWKRKLMQMGFLNNNFMFPVFQSPNRNGSSERLYDTKNNY